MPLNNSADYRTAIQALVRDGGSVLVDPDDYDRMLEDALKRLAKAEPRRVVVDVDGDGGFDYVLPAPFDAAFSRVLEVEYPAGQRQRCMVDRLDWELYEAPAGPALRFLVDTPAVGETIRVMHTALHVVDAGSSTVPSAREDAVKLLAAALCCEALSAHYSNSGDALIGADSVDHKSKASEYAARAKRFMKLAEDLLPVEELGEAAAASGFGAIGVDQDFLTHPNR